MSDLTIDPEAEGGLAGSVRGTLTDLAAISSELDDGPPVRPSIASRLDTLAGELRDAAAMVRAIPEGSRRG